MAMLSGVSVRTASALALAVFVWAQGASALAQAMPESLRQRFTGSSAEDGRDKNNPPVARYVSGSGATFVLDRSGRHALLQFQGSVEIWVLKPSPGPRGDLIYKNDLGQPVLRSTRLGGMTLFTREHPEGMPAALVGETAKFRPPTLSPQAVLQSMTKASARAGRAAQRLIPFEAGKGRTAVTPATSFLVADAANVAAEAISRLAMTPTGRNALKRVKKVMILYGERPGARVVDGIVEVIIAPQHGMAGRPSSGLIMRAIAAR